MNTSSTMVTMAGRPIGTSTRHRIRQEVAPSTRAASDSSGGSERKKARIQNTPNEIDRPVWGRIRPQ